MTANELWQPIKILKHDYESIESFDNTKLWTVPILFLPNKCVMSGNKALEGAFSRSFTHIFINEITTSGFSWPLKFPGPKTDNISIYVC